MALIILKFFKVLGLPSEPEANAVYYVIGDDFAEWYVTDADGVASPSGNSAMINALIEAAELAPLTHNHAIGDVTGLQSALNGKISDAESFTIGMHDRAKVKFDGENKKVTIGDANNNGGGTTIIVDDGNEAINLNADAGITMNSTKFIGLIASGAPPTITEFPNDKDWGFHINTFDEEKRLYIAFNDAGTMRAIRMTAEVE